MQDQIRNGMINAFDPSGFFQAALGTELFDVESIQSAPGFKGRRERAGSFVS